MLAALTALLADHNLPDINPDPGPYLALLGLGFLVGALGHLFKVKLMIAAGILMIFCATILIPLYVQLSRG
ncbi:MAG: hypothetical protein M3340_01810 [Actinomycetota bacterium]|nr:hypothetical protein [Actinomycetota bacterium]